MLSWEQFMDIKSLAASGVSRREIARRTGHARDTVRKVLNGTHKMRVERRKSGW
jgi:DNA-binding CsgD family transcriptional regulator